MTNVLVVGSINMDIVTTVKKHPKPGETIKGYSTTYIPGGKGANQAVAASLSGGEVMMIGAVGTDGFGNELIRSLSGYEIYTNFIQKKEGNSGLAFITVDEAAENSIILSEGANAKLSISDIDGLLANIEKADVILLQNEIPWESTYFTMEIAKQRGIPVFFNPAPALQVSNEVLSMIDTIILNETEAEMITNIKIATEKDAVQAAEKLIENGVNAVIITLGVKGSVYLDQFGKRLETPAFEVKPVDTTAAGDTFIGAYASRIFDTSVEEALEFASAAAALSVTKTGAQASIPTYEEVQAFLR